MSDGMRCDGCKEMIVDDSYLQLDRRGSPDEDQYVRTLESVHFHGYHCIYRFMNAPGLNEGFFPRKDDEVDAG